MKFSCSQDMGRTVTVAVLQGSTKIGHLQRSKLLQAEINIQLYKTFNVRLCPKSRSSGTVQINLYAWICRAQEISIGTENILHSSEHLCFAEFQIVRIVCSIRLV